MSAVIDLRNYIRGPIEPVRLDYGLLVAVAALLAMGLVMVESASVARASEMGNPLPKAFKDAAEFIINTDLRRLLSAESCDTDAINSLVDNARTWNSELDNEGHGYLLQNALTRMITRFAQEPNNIDLLERLIEAIELSRGLPFPVDLGEVQTTYYRMLDTTRQERKAAAESRDEAVQEWLEKFHILGNQLMVRTG